MLDSGDRALQGGAVSDLRQECERESIHIPNMIQPHGCMLVLAEDGCIAQISSNVQCEWGLDIHRMLGCRLVDAVGDLFGHQRMAHLQSEIESRLHATADENALSVQHSRRPVWMGSLTMLNGATANAYDVVGHRTATRFVLELERVERGLLTQSVTDIYPLVDDYTLQIETADSIGQMCQITAETVRGLSGFDRVLIYRFENNWDGMVIGESGSGRLPSYRDHRFPASDIPAQARELYRKSRLRIIPNVNYQAVPLIPPIDSNTSQLLDMSYATLRSVSPVHLEYMRNMETAASMSVSILRNNQLWGLISMHHHTPRTLAFPLRTACDLIARAFSLRLSAVEHADNYEHRSSVRAAYATLLSEMTDRGDFTTALAARPDDLLRIAGAHGAAIVTKEGCQLIGNAPTELQVRELGRWLFSGIQQDVFATDRLPSLFPASGNYKNLASGLLAIAISKLHASYIMWFRPEVVQTIRWGGVPAKTTRIDGTGGLHPRQSFATWLESVNDLSAPWNPCEIDAATDLRNAIVGSVLRRAEEMAALNAELTHSNNELEAFSYSVSHDLRAPLRHIVGYAEILREDGLQSLSVRGRRCVDTIIESSEYAGRLVDKLLNYSRLGRSDLQYSLVDMSLLFKEVRADVMRDASGRSVQWNLATLPIVTADLMMLRMVVRDLLSNAVKYTRHRDVAVIDIGFEAGINDYTFWVKDNGVGFSMEYVGKLFGVFQRLHRWEDFEGTGIGLANVRRIIERHAGRAWAEGEENAGATFYFTLPISPCYTATA